ncbi:ribosome biogenesis GTPase Der [Luteithermobacter gelatinilyticus]|uniref:ribosome biogenesis GTPase Der n=1 Tax=Luteithermobacter gelatinilyticus TaxID=2582913 RepID=UPI001106CAD7|nr:ribosome biogenesis GTPase Der [Luteithermobacter gelatinilyticus]|tara:strand:+ start:75 stop:1493 length:1419 start_codon:yes stop_codon:yes gene_type:complete
MSFTVAIIGRPNVGKSTLFNRLVGKRLALVDDTPGVTRDRREALARLGPFKFRIIDTAGLEEGKGDSLSARMWRQTEKAIEEADFSLFMIDARAGVTPLDRHFADILRKGNHPLLLLANKAEGRAGEQGLYEAYELGLGDPIPVSAEHGEGLAELIEGFDRMIFDLNLDSGEGEDDEVTSKSVDIVGEVTEEQESESEVDSGLPLQMAIVGRPNVGKSTLVNRLLGEDRQITGPEAGLTRDTIGITFDYQGREIRMFDTAGLRRKSRIQDKLEKLSVADTIRALNFAEVVVLMVDVTQPFERQDLNIASLIVQEGRALVIALNKYDLIENRQEVMKDIQYKLEHTLPQVKGIPLVPLSALTGRHVDKLMPAVFEAYRQWNRRISTAKLNKWLAATTEYHPAPSVKGKRIKLRYMTQVKTRPPTFAIFCNRPADVATSYQRYLINELRWDFDLPGVPIRLLLRGGDNPFAKKS